MNEIKPKLRTLPDITRSFDAGHDREWFRQKCECGTVLRLCDPGVDYAAAYRMCPRCKNEFIVGNVIYTDRFKGLAGLMSGAKYCDMPAGWSFPAISAEDQIDRDHSYEEYGEDFDNYPEQ